LHIKIDHYQKYEKEIEALKKELFTVKVNNNELRIENEKIKTEKLKYQSEMKQLEIANKKTTEKIIKYENQWRDSNTALRILINDKNLSDLNKDLDDQINESSFSIGKKHN